MIRSSCSVEANDWLGQFDFDSREILRGEMTLAEALDNGDILLKDFLGEVYTL